MTFTTHSFSQDTSDYFNPSFLRYENHIYRPTIKTVILERKGVQLSDPVVLLNKRDETLRLSFDELSQDIKDFSYRWIHCDANWQPSHLLSESDYIDGFYEDHIVNYRHSFNTSMEYYHYWMEFPNEQMRPILSGNYLLVVFETADPDKPVITKRFWIVENIVEIVPLVHRATDVSLRNTHQEIDFKILLNTLKVSNPYSDIKVVIVQNNRWDAAISNLKPQYVLDGTYEYNYEEGNLFEGGNEFRSFDTRSTRFLTEFTDHFTQDPNTHLFDAWLKPEVRKGTQRYAIQDDIDGRFLIKIYDDRDGEFEGDYVNVHFTLPVIEESDSGSYYLFGQLTDWNIVPWARMVFNEETGNYEQNILLKQGYYNYEYLFLPAKSLSSTIAETEGCHYETHNSYYFYVYWHDSMSRYDHLVGFKRVDSNFH